MTQKNIVPVLGLILATALLFPLTSRAQSAANDKDTVFINRNRIFPVPILFYTPETGVAGGAAALYLMRDSSSGRPSSITADAIYTEQKQSIFEIDGDMYFQRHAYRLLSSFVFQKYPNKFFGIGNFTAASDEETYTPESFVVRAVLYRNVFARYNIGPLIRYESVSMREVKPAGLLAPGTIAGSRGSKSSGLGLVANWDSRDNTFAASSGSFYQLTGLFYNRSFGGDYNFSDILFDTRLFFQTVSSQVLAVQAAAEFMQGTVPFQDLVRFGGQNIIRGYFDGRYRDKNGMALQAEYRVPVWWKFGVVAFAGAAQVADQVSHFGTNRFWFAGGLGLRFFWNPKEHISLRLDYGVGNNSSGVYITVTEAF